MAKNYASRNIRGKLRVCNYLLKDAELRQYVPRTVSFSRSNLQMMTDAYSSIYVKPDIGSLGIGVCKVKRKGKGYELKAVDGKRQWSTRYDSFSGLYQKLSGMKGKLIIQQGIKLDRVNGRPYDIRAMVQRRPGGNWVCTGYMVKVGAAKKIVTNYYQGGTIYTLGKLHRKQGLSGDEASRRERTLSSASLRIARSLSGRRTGMNEMGIDFARDSSGSLWVLEVNSNHPQFHPLKNIDPVAYQKMKRYASYYGRRTAK
ncbi:hypothetical protein D3P07_13095 [Paenibacillus sp. 1011MAR3C5]|uniref:YheC/YheD family protein n=1 Tax=Paenibacillus sp. 1011MAR3C5 TaxID=1675787 RepID=UPI000E6C7484|nr:YheC/YheD family protein [Paenibacillus sp. 1011MAR3C5]RJE88890.1 hypothetical protein D3P07_13095 [Paenibacillus sp. 1011MAR3C5]